MSLFVKMCGITRLEDALCAAEHGATAIGFNFYPASARYIPPARAAEIIKELGGRVISVGVFVNTPSEDVMQIERECGLDLLQFHGDEQPLFCEQWGDRVIRALRLSAETDLEQIREYSFARMILVDAAVKGSYGGTGTVANWELARKATGYGIPVLLAGGLTPENAAEAIRAVEPFGVDVAGGVEQAPGIKDPEKIERFMKVVQGMQTKPGTQLK